MLAATLCIAALALVPQGDPSIQYPVTLKKGSMKKLQKRLSDMLEDQARLSSMKVGDPARSGARERLGKSRMAFRAEWDRQNKEGRLLRSMGDLLEMFRTAYPYEKQRGKGKLLMEEQTFRGGLAEFGLMIPKKYKVGEPAPMVISVPGMSSGSWLAPDKHYKATWDGSDFAKTGLVVVPKLPKDMELDPMPDVSQPTAFAAEVKRMQVTAGAALYKVLRSHRVDSDRVFLDCGKGASAFGLRVATYAPRWFAGLILRDPKDIEGMRLGSLLGTPVLLLKSSDNAAEVDKLKQRLDAVDGALATVLEVSGDAPYTDQTGAITEWMAGVRRNLFQSRVVVEPNYDLFKDACWAYIDRASSISEVADDKRPRLEVVADRESNRLTVKTVNVDSFYVFLNDALLDLDKEFTVEINGVATTHKFQRSINQMIKWSADLFPASDPSYLFPVRFSAAVPKVEEEDEKQGEGSGGDGND